MDRRCLVLGSMLFGLALVPTTAGLSASAQAWANVSPTYFSECSTWVYAQADAYASLTDIPATLIAETEISPPGTHHTDITFYPLDGVDTSAYSQQSWSGWIPLGAFASAWAHGEASGTAGHPVAYDSETNRCVSA